LKPLQVSTDRSRQLLEDWSRAETAGTPLQLLLTATRDHSALSEFMKLMQAMSSPPRDWFSEAFATSLTRRLLGDRVGEAGWVRNLMPAEAVATLRLLVTQLERVKTEMNTSNAPAHTKEIVDHVISLAGSSAGDLEQWLSDSCRECEQVANKKYQLEQTRRSLLRLQDRIYLDLDIEPKQVQDWAREGLERWLGTQDTVSAIRQRLFFSITADGSRARASVTSLIAKEPQHFTAANEVAEEIDKLASTLALNVPTVRIGGVLANMTGERRRDLAKQLVHKQRQPRHVLLVSPRAEGLEANEQQALAEFEKSVPEPPSQGQRINQHGDDHSAIRRLELTEAATEQVVSGGSPVFVEMTESIAETIRFRAQNKYQLTLPIFPPRLRIALTHADAFKSFAHAYKAGHITLRPDAQGREQWQIANQFLTFDRESTLAHAACNYARDMTNFAGDFEVRGAGGNFEKLEAWIKGHGVTDSDTLTQIAIDVTVD
jgi:hypothetical protein